MERVFPGVFITFCTLKSECMPVFYNRNYLQAGFDSILLISKRYVYLDSVTVLLNVFSVLGQIYITSTVCIFIPLCVEIDTCRCHYSITVCLWSQETRHRRHIMCLVMENTSKSITPLNSPMFFAEYMFDKTMILCARMLPHGETKKPDNTITHCLRRMDVRSNIPNVTFC